MHSEMGPVRRNPIQRTVITAHLCVLMTVYSFSAQYNSSDNLPSYLQTNIMAQNSDIREAVPDNITGAATWFMPC